MRATILPKDIIVGSIMAKGCISACLLPLRCFLFLLPNYVNLCAIIMQYFACTDKREVLQQELPSPHFRWVVSSLFLLPDYKI